MDSPVQIPFKSFIQLKPSDPTAIYLQIVFEFIKVIQLGLLPEGTKLPGTRILCKLLSVNRNTLIRAFEDLEAQGWIEILPNKGTFILSDQKSKSPSVLTNTDKKTLQEVPTGFNFKKSTVLENPLEVSDLPYQFNDGLPDLRLMNTNVLGRLYLSKLKTKAATKPWELIQAKSHSEFRKHFTNYLNLTRGLRISSSNLLTTGSHEISLYLAAKLLIAPGDKVVVASPGYFKSNMTLSDCGAQIVTIPCEKDGININELKRICRETSIRALYLTSHYHYPTTIGLSAKKRMEMLKLSEQFGFVILEDDYDFEFHYDNNTVLPLAAFDSYKRVIYIGSFGRSLPSGFGYGFITAPSEFITELEKHQNIVELGIDVIKEQALTDWIKEGEVHRLFKKNRKTYKERRDYFITLLKEKFGKRIKFKIPPRGMAVWVEWQDNFNLIVFQRECAANGLFLPKTILYQNKYYTATRLGFGHFDKSEMEKATDILKQSLAAVVGA